MKTARKVEISSGYLGFNRRKEGHRRKSFYDETTVTENFYTEKCEEVGLCNKVESMESSIRMGEMGK